MVQEAADDEGSGAKLCGQLREAGLLAGAGLEAAGEVGEAECVGAVVEAAPLAVDDREAAADGEPARVKVLVVALPMRLGCRGEPERMGNAPTC